MYKILILFFFILAINLEINASENNDLIKKNILNYIHELETFSSKFIQSDGISIEEGNLYIKNNRLRIDYHSPKKIRIIISKDKAMYFDEELQELNYFNPEKSIAKVFYDIFFSKKFFENFNLEKKQGFLIIKRKIYKDQTNFDLAFYFETSPIVFRKIEIIENNNTTTLSILNPNHNPQLPNKFFSMASPLIN